MAKRDGNNRENKLLLDIAREAIASVPDSWGSFSLRLTHKTSDENDGEYLAHEFVARTFNQRDLPQPTDQLFKLTWKLFTFHRRKHKKAWAIADYAITQLESGDWHFGVEFTYPEQISPN